MHTPESKKKLIFVKYPLVFIPIPKFEPAVCQTWNILDIEENVLKPQKKVSCGAFFCFVFFPYVLEGIEPKSE